MRKWMSIFAILAMLLSCAGTAVADEPETVQVAYMLTMNAAEERGLVQDEINRVLERMDAGYRVELVCIDFASWGTQINLSLADGGIDLFNACFTPGIHTLANNGSISPLDDLINEYAPGLLRLLDPYIQYNKVNGQIYGTPKVGEFSSKLVVGLNKQLTDEMNINPADIIDFESLEKALTQVEAVHPEMAMIATDAGGFFPLTGVDTLNTNDPLGCLMLKKGSDSLTVTNYYESEKFKQYMAYARRWSQMGFFMDDPLNATDGALAYIADGIAYSCMMGYSSAEIARSTQEQNMGREIYCVEVEEDAWATSNSVTSWVWCIPAMSQHKESAMKFLNELYTNPEIANLVCNGIENKHYVQTGDGNITFAEGLDAFTTGWPSGMGTFWPNICITYPWQPDPATIYESWLKTNETCQKSPAMGFMFDASEVEDQITGCGNVIDKYVGALLLGIGDDAMYDEFIASLYDNGLQDIINEKQRQIDAWAANR